MTFRAALAAIAALLLLTSSATAAALAAPGAARSAPDIASRPPKTSGGLHEASASAFDLDNEAFYAELAQVFARYDRLFSTTTSTPLSSSRSRANVTSAEAELDRLIFDTPMADFVAARAAHDPPTFDWESDGCSMADDYPFEVNFHDSCVRHDFGYRNYKQQKRCSDEDRKRVDDNFRADLLRVCARAGWWKRLRCNTAALSYWALVRAGGHFVWCEGVEGGG